MDRKELINRLNNQGIPSGMYTFDEELPDDKFVVFFDYKKWHVYYCERGKKFEKKSFTSEDAAYSHLLTLM